MKFYYSYFTPKESDKNKQIPRNSQLMELLLNKSFHKLKKHYNEIHFITDDLGKEKFKNLGWSSITTELEGAIPESYSNIWSLGKLISYNIASKKGDPFIHLDCDSFLLKPFSQKILDSDILVENIETIYGHSYFYEKFMKNCPEIGIARNLETGIGYNCGIFGGRNLDFIQRYSQGVLDLIFNEKNKNFFSDRSHSDPLKVLESFSYAGILEQYYLSLYLNFYQLRPIVFYREMLPKEFEKDDLFEYDPNNINYLNNTGYIHLYGKNKIGFLINSSLLLDN
jgi:hypothetical protein